MNLKWIPKNDTIAVFGKGVIPADKFSQEDLDLLIKRAENRNQDVPSFLIRAGLKKVNPQIELALPEPKPEQEFKEEEALVEEPKEEKPKKSRKQKEAE